MDPQHQQANEFIDRLRQLARSKPERVSVAVFVNGQPAHLIAPERSMRLRSMSKMLIGLAYAREAETNPQLVQQLVDVAAIDRVNPPYFDGGAHKAWKQTLGGEGKVPMEKIAKGMMINSSNACTQFMLDTLGADKVNAIIREYGLKNELFGATYDELNKPLHGTAKDMVTLLENIATREPASVRSRIDQIAHHRLISVEHGEAAGFGKGGSGIIPGGFFSGSRHDLNASVCVQNKAGERVTLCMMTNDLDKATNAYLEERAVSFLCETSCNQGIRGRLTQAVQKVAAAMQAIPAEWASRVAQNPGSLLRL